MFCPKCRREIPDPDAVFCPFCGARLADSEEFPDDNRDAERDGHISGEKYLNNKASNLLIVLIIILSLVLAILLLLLNDEIREKIFDHDSNDVKQEEETFIEEKEEEPLVVNQDDGGQITEDTTETILWKEPEQEEKKDEKQGQIFYDSSYRILSWDEINSLRLDQIQDAINELFARRGYIFNDVRYRSYYEQFSWYHGTVSSENFTNDLFSDIELENVERLTKRRKELQDN